MAATFRVDNVSDLLTAASQPDVWVLEGLIEAGDQVVLAGAPKSGKSLMASQIALAVASGGKFLGWKAPTQRKVLYVNLELRPKRFGRRLIAQVGGARHLSHHTNLLTINDLRTLDILNPTLRDEFAELVRSENIELVIWDVLARMHGEDENGNPCQRRFKTDTLLQRMPIQI
jgi:RecA-family ATPase